MRNTINNNAWNTTEWGLAFLRVSSFPLDPSCTFETEEEFLNYLSGGDTDKPYLGLLIAVQSDKYHIFLVQSHNDGVWLAEELNKSDLDEINSIIEEFKEKVKEDLLDLEDSIKGNILPEYDTLEKLQNDILKHRVLAEQAIHNLQTELDLTQTGVGLSGDGAFNSDLETNYLRSATSVMNALRILDGKIHEAIIKLDFTPSNKDIIPIEISNTSDGKVISASLSLSNTLGNQLIKKSDGLYNNVTLDYLDGVITLKVNDNIISLHNLGISALVEDAYYDSSLESLVFIFKLLDGTSQRVRIPVGSLIREWDVDNSGASKVVELTREESIGEGLDRLSADVRISTKLNNRLVKDGNTLYVDGTSDSIIYNGSNLTSTLSNIESALSEKADIDSPVFKGVPMIENSPDYEDSSLRIPSTNWVNNKITAELNDVESSIKDNIMQIIESRLQYKADLVNGRVPDNQSPVIWEDVQ